MGLLVEFPEDIAERLRARAAERGEGVDSYTVSAVIAQLNREDAGRAEGQRLLHEPARRFDLEEIRKGAGLPPGRSPEQIEASYEEALAALTPEQRANAERLGLI